MFGLKWNKKKKTSSNIFPLTRLIVSRKTVLADNIHERVHSAPADSARGRPDKNSGKEHSARWNVANPVLSSGRASKVKSCRERTFSGGYSRGRTPFVHRKIHERNLNGIYY